MSEQASKNELSIQLPWTVPQPPLYSTHIAVDPKTNKIPLDIQHSTDGVAVGAIILSLLAFIATIIIVRSSTKQQIESNKELIGHHERLKNIEIMDKHNQEILKELTLFEQTAFEINVYLKSRSDGRSETQQERDKVSKNLDLCLHQIFKLQNLMQAYKGVDLVPDLRNVNVKQNELIESVLTYQQTGIDIDIAKLDDFRKNICECVHTNIKKAA